MNSESVFSRTGSSTDEISGSLYNFIIGMALLWGFGMNWYIVQTVPVELIASINPWVFFIGYFVSCIGGCVLFNASSNPVLSFIGYNMVVLPFGLIVNLVVSKHDAQLVQDAIFVTGGVTIIMMALGTLFPAFFKRIAGALFFALLATLIVELVAYFVFGKRYGITDWIVAAIFCGYIGVDWGRANAIPKTVDNAIDSAAALYMDIINLFLRILEIMARAKE